jgi:hypothetical protein
MYMKIAPRKEEGSSTYYIEVEGNLHLSIRSPLNLNCRNKIFPSPL